MPASDQGVIKDRYMLIPRTLIFITRGESVLLLKGAPHKRIWANRYNGVGGHIERGEDVIKPEALWLCGTVTVDTGENIGIGLYVMKGFCSEGTPLASEEGELEWVLFKEIQSKALVDDLPRLLPRVMGQSPGDPPFSAHYHYNQQDILVADFGY